MESIQNRISRFDSGLLSPQYGAFRTSLRMASFRSPFQFARTAERNSSKVQNLSMLIYSAARRHVDGTFYAVSTAMFLVLLILLLVVNRNTAEAD